MIELKVKWVDRWKWWHGMYPSRYAKGVIGGDDRGVDEIYRHKKSDQIRLYSDLDLDGVEIAVNGRRVTLNRRGRTGTLYLGS